MKKTIKDKHKSTDTTTTKTTVTDVNDVTDVTDVTSVNKLSVTPVTCYSEVYSTIFTDKTIDLILKEFVTKKECFTFDELAKNLGKKEGTIRQNINRYKDYFDVKLLNGKKCNSFLSQIAIDEINLRIERIKAEKEQKRAMESAQIQEKMRQETLQEKINTFLKNCKLERENKLLILDFNDILTEDVEMADYLLDKPIEFIELIKLHYDDRYDIKFINFPDSINVHIENIRKEHLNKIVCIEGRLTSFGEVKPVITKITFECPSCGSTITMNQNYRDGKIKEPSGCSCGRKNNFRAIKRSKNNSCFLQLEDLQDKTDNPHSQRIKAVIFNELCNKDNINIFSPGNEIKCYGILKEVPVYKKNSKTIFLNWILEIVSAELIDKDIDISLLTKEEVKKIKDLSKEIDSKGLKILNNSFAPDIYGYDAIKESLILQLCNKRNNKKDKIIRNKSNILLIGDPGVAKSVLCNFALDITHGSRKAVGGGSSAVGITASVVREEESMGGYRVEPGAMILAKDLLFIDEMNNLSDDDKPKLQEGMNEQTVSINKANLHVQMKVTCGIIAAANPKNGNFTNPFDSKIEEQFNIPTPILNRFDLIFVLMDNICEEDDKKIAERMIQRHRGEIKPTYDKNFLKNFFAYIKMRDEPIIDDYIQKKLLDVYSNARKYNGNSVKINPRFLEALTRLCTSSAKIRQSPRVELKDILTSLKIISHSQYKIEHKLILEKLK